MRTSASWFVALLFLALLSPLDVEGSRDGIYNKSSGCTCHQQSTSVSPSIAGLPSDYVAGTTYSLTIGMSGNPTNGGFNLKVTKGTLSNPGTDAQIAGNGLQATHTESQTTSSWTLDWTAPSAGSGSVSFDMAVVSGNGNGQKSSADVYNTFSTSISEAVASNDPPSISDLALSPSSPTTLDDITATYTYSDNDGDVESGTTFAWHLNGTLEPTHTGAVVPASVTARGQTWHVVVTPSDGVNAGTGVTSTSVLIVNSAPVVSSINVSSETPDTTDDVSFTFTTSDPDGDAVTASETRWRLDGSSFSSLDNTTTLPALATRAGDVWDVQVRVSDGDNMSAWFTSPSITIGSSNTAPVVSDLNILPLGGPTTVDDLTATWQEEDNENDAIVNIELQWTRNGQHVIAADNLNPLTPEYTTKGEVWSVSVRIFDGEAWSLWEESAAVTIGNAAPSIVEAHLTSPSNSALHDLQLELDVYDEDDDEVSVSLVQWYLDGEAQTVGENQTTLSATHLSRGDRWHAVVLVSDGEDLTLATTEPVDIGNALPQVSLSWPQSADALTDLTPAIDITDADNDATTVTINWFKNGFRDASLTNATTVPASKLAPLQAWTLVVEASDGESSSGVVEATFTVPNLGPSGDIRVLSSDIWLGESTVLSGEDSVDPDGEITTYTWSWDGQFASGQTITVVLDQSVTMSLTVTDQHGASSTTTMVLEATRGPQVQGLSAEYDGTENVALSWTWTGEEVSFNVLRNGVVVGTTQSTTYTDQPTMSGMNTYSIQPVNDERTFLQATSTTEIQADVGAIETPEPSAILGYGLGGLLVLSLFAMQWLGRKTGGEV